jgi:hypothetical protein
MQVHARPKLYEKDRCSDGHVTVSVAVLTPVTYSDDDPPKATQACNHLHSVEWGVRVDLQLSDSVGFAVRFRIASLLLER